MKLSVRCLCATNALYSGKLCFGVSRRRKETEHEEQKEAMSGEEAEGCACVMDGYERPKEGEREKEKEKERKLGE
jgi:hypothetical protein